MLQKRRLAMQLTPLLDLLLIVMFSQYIENRHRSVAIEESLTEREQAIDARQQQLEVEVAEQKQTLEQLAKTYDERFQSIINQHHQVGSILAESLNLPGNVMAEVIKLRTSGSADDAVRPDPVCRRPGAA